MSPDGYQSWHCQLCGASGPGWDQHLQKHLATHPEWATKTGLRLRRLAQFVEKLGRWFDGVTK